MLTIRAEQLAAMSRAKLEDFVVRLAQSLADSFPERFGSAEAPEVTTFARRAMTIALEHGITTERSVADFARLRVSFGEAFEWTPVADRALALLRDPTLPGPIKVAAIQDCLLSSTGGRLPTPIPEEQG
ncbi:MAG TPA: hypothetical protein VK034_18980 [Enhygromyxa sp.]|nr:hypothetical protein [Enhygromyxa sp.]